jgi:hypothetical protein
MVFVLLVAACASGEIDGSKVNINDQTHEYTYKDGGAKVTGTMVFSAVDEATGKPYSALRVQVKDGKRVGTAHAYYPNGKIAVVYSFDANGMQSGIEKDYDESGKLKVTSEYKNDKKNGATKGFDQKGVLISEGDYKDNVLIVFFMFDSSGHKYVPDEFKLVGTWKWGRMFKFFLTLNDDKTYQERYELVNSGTVSGTYVINSEQKLFVLKPETEASFLNDIFQYSFIDDNTLLFTTKEGVQSTAQRQPSP